MRNRRGFVGLLSLAVGAAGVGCSAEHHAKDVRAGSEASNLTVGTVQREITKGMAASQVVEALGAPNIVTTDENGREVWVYDRFATDVTSSKSGWFLFLASGSAGSASSSQRSLTVVIKFDENKKVRDFAYHSSKF